MIAGRLQAFLLSGRLAAGLAVAGSATVGAAPELGSDPRSETRSAHLPAL